MMRIAALTLALVALCGCSQESADWHGDMRFSADERAAIESGEAWLARSAGREPASFAWDYEVTNAQRLPHTIRRERGPIGAEGTTGACVEGVVYLDPDDRNATPGTLDGLAAHEMGHCELGLADDPDSDGIMRVVYPMRWTDREHTQLAR